MNSIIWKGVSSTTISGLLISELPPISKPAMRVKETTIDGRDGSIIEELGYEPYDKPVIIGLHGNFDINKVIKYFNGEGEVVFSNEPDKVYTAKIVGQIDYNRLLRYRQATIIFRAQPFKHKLNEAYKPAPTTTVSGTSTSVNVSADTKIKAISIYGKTTQDGTPAPDAPVELVSVGDDKKLNVSVNGGALVKMLMIPMANGLRGIPVSSGGNYTDASGQQWVCDEMDFASGLYIQRVCENNTLTFGSSGTTNDGSYLYSAYLYGTQNAINTRTVSTHFKWVVSGALASMLVGTMIVRDRTDHPVIYCASTIPTVDGFNAWVRDNNVRFLSILATPIETPLADEHISFFSELKFNGITITNDEDASMAVEYFEPYEVFNEGLETSKPIMALKGSGTVVVSVNGLEIFQYTFPAGENEVVIDSEKEDAYLGDVLKNRNMNGEFPILLPGTNIIEWSGYVSSIEILPRSRWL